MRGTWPWTWSVRLQSTKKVHVWGRNGGGGGGGGREEGDMVSEQTRRRRHRQKEGGRERERERESSLGAEMAAVKSAEERQTHTMREGVTT